MHLKLTKLKRKYNEVLAIMMKAEAFFDNPEESMERKQKWVPKFNKITRELSTMMMQYQELTCIEMTEDEVLYGFRLQDMME